MFDGGPLLLRTALLITPRARITSVTLSLVSREPEVSRTPGLLAQCERLRYLTVTHVRVVDDVFIY